MLNQTLLNGEMAGYNSAQVGVEVMIRRLESWRNELAQWIEKNIFLPVAKMQGFIDEEESKEFGETVYLYPRIKWDDLRLRDNTNQLQMFLQMQQSGLISAQTLLEEFDLDYDLEVERIRNEQVQAMQNGQLMATSWRLFASPLLSYFCCGNVILLAKENFPGTDGDSAAFEGGYPALS